MGVHALTGGKTLIVSGDAMHDTERRSGTFQAGGFWQGVSVSMEFRRDRLTNVNFRDLLPPLEGAPQITLRFE